MSAISRTDIETISVFGVSIAAVAVSVVLWLAHSGSRLAAGGYDSAIALGRLSGIILMLLILAQLLLASRMPFLDRFEGFFAFRVHRVLGFSILAVIAAHVGFLTYGYAGGTGMFTQFGSFITDWNDVGIAALGALVVIAIGVVSIPAIRKLMNYDLWYLAHLTLYLAIALSIGHEINTGDMANGFARVFWIGLIAIVFLVFIAYRIARPAWYFFRCGFRIARVVKESESTTSIYITGTNLSSFRFEAGQYAHFIFLQRQLFAHHPFSFSQPFNGSEIRITVKNLGDFTGEVSRLRVGTRVIIDGPMGHLTLRMAQTENVCLIAGGVGITPIAALARDLPNPGTAVALISNRTPTDAPLLEEVRNTGIALKSYFSDVLPRTLIDGDEIMRMCPDVRTRDVYICGPDGMMRALSRALIERGVPRGHIHTERFSY